MISGEKQGMDYTKMSLEHWLRLFFEGCGDPQFVDYKFPTDKMLQEYIENIDNRSEDEVIALLRKFLIPTGAFGSDRVQAEILISYLKKGIYDEFFRNMIRSEHNKRILRWIKSAGKVYPWEGITWIIGLLPDFPRDALQGLDAYFLAHGQALPDGRLEGLSDAMTLIRAKFIGLPKSRKETIELLLQQSPRIFECLIERTYNAMGYTTQLTAPSNDGGRDVIAYNEILGKRESIRIEGKLYRNNVGVDIARALLGVVSDEKVNKGVIVTTSGFTKNAKKLAERNPRLELIDGISLIPIMNEYLGTTWSVKIESLVAESERNYLASREHARKLKLNL